MAAFAQKNNNSNMDNYKSEWDKIDKLENEGKTKTALESIESILKIILLR
jgi:soluble cytochrome b562